MPRLSHVVVNFLLPNIVPYYDRREKIIVYLTEKNNIIKLPIRTKKNPKKYK